MFTYSQVEFVLAQIHHCHRETQKTAFRGRLQYFQRLGIPIGLSPGKGKKINYDFDHLYQYALCLEFAQFGMDPTLIVKNVTDLWPMVRERLKIAPDGSIGSDLLIVFSPEFMSWNWPLGTPEGVTRQRGMKDLRFVDRSQLPKILQHHRRLCVLRITDVFQLAQKAVIGSAERQASSGTKKVPFPRRR